MVEFSAKGSFSGPGISSAFTPAPNAAFFIQLGGNFSAAFFFMSQSVGGAPYTLMNDQYGNILQLSAPGAVQIVEVPYTPRGMSVVPSYQLVCQTVSGTATYTFYQ